MRALGLLVYPLFAAQTTQFNMLDVCYEEGEWVGNNIESHEIRNGNNVQEGFMSVETP